MRGLFHLGIGTIHAIVVEAHEVLCTMCLTMLPMQGAEAPRVDIAEAQPLENYPRAVQEHICEHWSSTCLVAHLSKALCTPQDIVPGPAICLHWPKSDGL